MEKTIPAIILFFLLSISCAWGAQYFVAQGGKDTNSGTSALPWGTIGKAANSANPGDLVIINQGNYDERPIFSRSGSATRMITFKAVGRVVTKGFIVPGDYLCIDGFEAVNPSSYPIMIQGSYNQVINFYAHDSGLFVYCLGSHNLVQKGKIYMVGQCGIRVEGSKNTIAGNDISHILQHPRGGPAVFRPDADGIRFYGSGHIIRGNYIHDILLSDPGQVDPHIDCFQTTRFCGDITFEENKCFNPGNGMQEWMINALQNLSGLKVINNIIYAFRGGNFWHTPGIIVANNIFATNPVFDIGPFEYGGIPPVL